MSLITRNINILLLWLVGTEVLCGASRPKSHQRPSQSQALPLDLMFPSMAFSRQQKCSVFILISSLVDKSCFASERRIYLLDAVYESVPYKPRDFLKPADEQ